MDIIEKIGDTITEKGKVAADKAKELAAIANLKSQISTCEEVMKKNHRYLNYMEHPFCLLTASSPALQKAWHPEVLPYHHRHNMPMDN